MEMCQRYECISLSVENSISASRSVRTPKTHGVLVHITLNAENNDIKPTVTICLASTTLRMAKIHLWMSSGLNAHCQTSLFITVRQCRKEFTRVFLTTAWMPLLACGITLLSIEHCNHFNYIGIRPSCSCACRIEWACGFRWRARARALPLQRRQTRANSKIDIACIWYVLTATVPTSQQTDCDIKYGLHFAIDSNYLPHNPIERAARCTQHTGPHSHTAHITFGTEHVFCFRMRPITSTPELPFSTYCWQSVVLAARLDSVGIGDNRKTW